MDCSCPECWFTDLVKRTSASAKTAAKRIQGLPKMQEQGEKNAPTRLPTDSKERKQYPLYSGFVVYFPDAMAYVASISWVGNQKHNPGSPLHWSRDKSTDHLDCIGRHLVEAGTVDPASGFLHDGMLAWRAMANLQVVLEKLKGVPPSPGSK